MTYAVEEYAQTAIDILARRTRLAFLNVHAAEEALPKIIELMADELGWSNTKQEVYNWCCGMISTEPNMSNTKQQHCRLFRSTVNIVVVFIMLGVSFQLEHIPLSLFHGLVHMHCSTGHKY